MINPRFNFTITTLVSPLSSTVDPVLSIDERIAKIENQK